MVDFSRESRFFHRGFFHGSRTAERASVVFQMRTREDKADLGPPGDRGVRVTRSLGWGWDPPGVALTPGARVARHAHRHHVRHSGHVRRQRLRARRCVARPHRARASPRGAPRGVAVLDNRPTLLLPLRVVARNDNDDIRRAARRAALGADLAPRSRAATDDPPARPRLPPSAAPAAKRANSARYARARAPAPIVVGSASPPVCRDDASFSDARQSIARSLPLRPLPRVSLTASPPPSSSALPSASFRTNPSQARA